MFKTKSGWFMFAIANLRAIGIYAGLHHFNMVPESKIVFFTIMLFINIPFAMMEVIFWWPQMRIIFGEIKKEESYMDKMKKELNLPEDWG
jgi:hypothetical protein